MLKTTIDSQAVSFCNECGQRVDGDHECELPDRILELDEQSQKVQTLVYVLIRAAKALEDEKYDKVAALAHVKRVLWNYQLTEKQKLFGMMRTTAELPTTKW